MMIFVAMVILQVVCAAHVIKVGKPPLWLLVILLLPVAGSLAYVVMEVLPDARR